MVAVAGDPLKESRARAREVGDEGGKVYKDDWRN